ncbi:MAG: phosphatidate cytidylyltransferase [Planctomycetota bacterium]
MLVWRLSLGVLLVAMLVGLAWLDFNGPRPGLYLAPLAVASVVLGANELVRLFEHNSALESIQPPEPSQRLAPSRYVVATGAALVTVFSFAPIAWEAYPADCPVGRIGWTAIGFAVALLLTVLIEMVRYQKPGVSTLRLSQAVLAIGYCGGLMGFAAQLRLLGGEPWGDDGRWGMVALLSLMAVVKANDTGAYTAGRLFGRHKMTPLLSPGKTWEGIAGGMLLSIAAAALCLGPIAQALGCEIARTSPWWWTGVVVYGVVVGAAGVAGDLAISLLKRDSGLKNSSSWMPGFGGVLDVLDSVLFAAPVAYACWLAEIVGP